MTPPLASTDGFVVRARDLVVTYGAVRALDGVSCAVPRGAIHGVLGPNGAGKSTLLHVLTGLEAPAAGSVTWDASLAPASFRVGYQPEEPALYDFLTVGEFLTLATHLAGDAGDEALTRRLATDFELGDVRDRLTHQLSAGTRRKVSVVAALAQRSTLLVLDEPTNGLDARAVARLKAELHARRAAGAPTVLSTHLFDFAGALCDSVTILARGRVAFEGPVAALPGYQGPASFDRVVSALLGL